MFIFAHASDFEYKPKESWRAKLAQAILNDEKSAILQEDIICKYQKLQNEVEMSNYINNQLCIQNQKLMNQNVEVLKQYDKIMNYQIYKIAFVVCAILLSVAFVIAMCVFFLIKNNFKIF